MELTLADVQRFGKGLMRWLENDEIEMSDLLEGNRINDLLTHILESSLEEKLDNDFNGMDLDELTAFLNTK
ncbi:MAG: hypothetical protein K2O00_02685 [Muribaculaceae bacterium]|nr:hypothetical protein [Muribaculaceae bacterium]